MLNEFNRRNVKVIGWLNPSSSAMVAAGYPVIIPGNVHIPTLFGVTEDSSLLPKTDLAPTKVVFVIGPDKKLRLTLLYPRQTVKQSDLEVLRVIDSLQMTERHRVDAWPADEDVILTTPSSSVVVLSGIDTATPRELPPELGRLFGKV